MRPAEYAMIRKLVLRSKATRTLEIGMANGGSTLQILGACSESCMHVAIDPFQLHQDGWKGAGMEAVKRAGLDKRMQLIEAPSYTAMPNLIQEGQKFQFILIDGWHSFDFTMVDFFFADLLLDPEGIIALHDTNLPSVHKVCRFIETHKPYERISPQPVIKSRNFVRKVFRRLGDFLKGSVVMREAKARREEWFTLSAYKKNKDFQVPNVFFARF